MTDPGTPPEAEPEWRKVFNKPAYPTLERWIHGEAKGGQKFISVMITCGSTMVARIRWTDGTVQDIRTGKRDDGMVTILASRPVAPEPVEGA